MRPVFLLCLCCGVAALPARAADRPAPLSADAALIRPYTYGLQAQEPFHAPYWAHYRRGGKDLYYVAARHGGDASAPTFALIRALFRLHPPDAAVIEGVKAERGISPRSLIAEYRRTSDGRVYKWGEPAFTALLAADHGKDFVGAEPSDAEVLRRLAAAGYGRMDLLGYYFLRQLPQMRRDGSLKKEGPEKAFDGLMRAYQDGLSLKPEELPSYADFLKWHRAIAGTEPNLDPRDYEAIAPLGDGTPVQRISAAVDKTRNECMVEQIARMLNAHDRVLVVLGSSHLTVQRPALEAMLGPAVEQSDRAPR